MLAAYAQGYHTVIYDNLTGSDGVLTRQGIEKDLSREVQGKNLDQPPGEGDGEEAAAQERERGERGGREREPHVRLFQF